MWPTYNEQLSNAVIPTEVLSLVPQKFMEQRFLMPLSFEEEQGLLTLVTSKYIENYADSSIILKYFKGNNTAIRSIKLLSISYDNNI